MTQNSDYAHSTKQESNSALGVRLITLESIHQKTRAITRDAVGFYKENCMVCFHRNGHKSGVVLSVDYAESKSSFQIQWVGEITEQILSAYRDSRRFTDFAASAIALALISELTDYIAVEQSVLGTTIDYYLVRAPLPEDLIFNYAARLEVSGILKESDRNTVDKRIGEKLNRLKIEGDLKDFIAVVEFSQPWSKMVQA